MASRATRQLRLAGLLVVAAALLVYVPTLGHELVYDDAMAIEQHPGVQWQDPAAIIASGFWGPDEAERIATWRPVVTFTFAVDVAVSRALGMRTAASLVHLQSIVWLALAGILLLIWLVELGLSPAAAGAAALLFVVHPGYSEATAFAVGRADTAMVAFGLLFALAHGRRRYGLAALWLACALACKEAAVLWPFAACGVWLARRLWLARRPRMARPSQESPWRWLVAYLLVGCVWLAGRWWVLGGLFGAAPSVVENPAVAADFSGRVVAAVLVWAQAARLLVWPASLASDYGLAAFPSLVAPPSASLGLGAIAAAGTLGLIWRGGRGSVAHAWAGGLLLGCGLLYGHVLTPLPTIFGERHWILAGVPFAVLVAEVVQRFGVRGRIGAVDETDLGPRRRAAVMAVVLVAVVLVVMVAAALRTRARLPSWSNNAVMYEAMVRDAPQSVRALINGASVALERGDIDSARQRLQRAKAIHPQLALIHLSLARVAVAAQDAPAAVAALATAASVGGKTDRWWAARCVERHRFATPKEAAAACTEALGFARNRTERDVGLLRGIARFSAGEQQAGFAEVVAALAKEGPPVNAQQARNAGVFFARAGRWRRAARWLAVAQEHRPDDPEIQRMLQIAVRRARSPSPR